MTTTEYLFVLAALLAMLIPAMQFIIVTYIAPLQNETKFLITRTNHLREQITRLEKILSDIPPPDESFYGELTTSAQNKEPYLEVDDVSPTQYDSVWSEIEDIKARGERFASLGPSRPVYPGQL